MICNYTSLCYLFDITSGYTSTHITLIYVDYNFRFVKALFEFHFTTPMLLHIYIYLAINSFIMAQ